MFSEEKDMRKLNNYHTNFTGCLTKIWVKLYEIPDYVREGCVALLIVRQSAALEWCFLIWYLITSNFFIRKKCFTNI